MKILCGFEKNASVARTWFVFLLPQKIKLKKCLNCSLAVQLHGVTQEGSSDLLSTRAN